MQSSNDFSAWIGKSETRTDQCNANQLAAWGATLDRDDDFPATSTEVPPGFHWTLFPPLARQSELGEDGHPHKGGFMPPISLPRRMWAGSRIEFIKPLLVGENVERCSTIKRIESKTGRSGTLVFVTLHHSFTCRGELSVSEEQDIVYRDAPAGPVLDTGGDPAPRGLWYREIQPTESQLFRYSALTFNAHRIHYDLPYATNTEGYPGLVVHGPLIATLLLDHLRRNIPNDRLHKFSFRAIRPTYLTTPFSINGQPGNESGTVKLWSTDNRGRAGMEAEAVLR